MAIIPVPASLRFEDFEIWLDAPSDEMKSPFNGRRQINKLPYDVWNFTGKIVPLDVMNAGPLKSFFMQLAGKVNDFKLKLAGSKYPTSGYQGANGTIINMVGATFIGVDVGAAQALAPLKEGDYFNIGDELKVATTIYFNPGENVFGVSFMPPLRNLSYAQPVTLTDPFLLLHATRDDIARWKVTAPVTHAFNLEAEETFV